METPHQAPKKHKFKKIAAITVVIIVIIWFIYYFICGLTYSEGTRSGILTKVSKKGYIFKTFEGDMNVGGLTQGDGTIMPMSIFKFSVIDEHVYNELQTKEGKKLILHYKQVMKNFFWQGETNRFVDSVNLVP